MEGFLRHGSVNPSVETLEVTLGKGQLGQDHGSSKEGKSLLTKCECEFVMQSWP